MVSNSLLKITLNFPKHAFVTEKENLSIELSPREIFILINLLIFFKLKFAFNVGHRKLSLPIVST